MPFRYPVALELEGRRCVVIGGGQVAEQKARALVEAGAAVAIVSRELTDSLEHWGRQGRIELLRKPYSYGDLEGAFLAVAASDDRSLNASIFKEAEERHVLLNAVDDIPHCHFAAPSIVRHGDFLLTISTGGKAPALAKKLRKELSELFGPEYGRLVDLLGRVRERMLPKRKVDFDTWAERWGEAMSEDLIGLVRDGRVQEAEERVAALIGETVNEQAEPAEGQPVQQAGGAVGPRSHYLEDAPNSVPPGKTEEGLVEIVGAGPGDPGLITVSGRRAIRKAEVVVADRLVNPDLVAGKEVIYVGKEPGPGQVAQDEINDLLIRLARQGRRVVRLKGGDPFVFGRGAEEAEALKDANVEFSVVPGTSSALAAVAAAGIPVTDRRFASSVAIATGHGSGSDADSEPDLRRLATAVDTIVILMGVSNLDGIVGNLIEGGRDPGEPAALIENGTLPSQRVIEDCLQNLVLAAEGADIKPPAIIVVGEVVRLRNKIRPG